MIDHIGFTIGNHARSLEFCRRARAPLGYVVVTGSAGWAAAHEPFGAGAIHLKRSGAEQS